MKKDNLNLFFIISLIIILIWSVINPKELSTWFMEVAPAVIGVAILAATYKKFEFTTLVYILIWIHAIILIVGGHYTYAKNPLFDWLKDIFNWERNYYDRLGHFAQGFIPAMITRELLLRTSPLKKGKWLIFIVTSICLAISAYYELIEFAAAKILGASAKDFLGTQGDEWDAQWDMLFAITGAFTALITLSKLHNKQMEKIK